MILGGCEFGRYERYLYPCFFGGYDRFELWGLWSWKLWTPPITTFDVHNLQSFGGYDPWRLWAWTLWTLPIPLFFGGYERFELWRLWSWTLWTPPITVFDVHNLQSSEGYDPWRLWAWTLWTLPIPLFFFGGYERWRLRFWGLWPLEVVALDVLNAPPRVRLSARPVTAFAWVLTVETVLRHCDYGCGFGAVTLMTRLALFCAFLTAFFSSLNIDARSTGRVTPAGPALYRSQKRYGTLHNQSAQGNRTTGTSARGKTPILLGMLHLFW